MTPKEKAKELYDKYFMKMEQGIDEDGSWICMALNHGMAKSCALIAVDEILKTSDEIQLNVFNETGYLISTNLYWQEVKNEINLL